jgi:SAM-dependent methyltransferase
MNNDTSQQLIALNHDFYQRVAPSFSATRECFWSGWERVKEQLENVMGGEKCHPTDGPTLNVLDFGCGNARLAVFFSQIFPSERPWSYYGWDNSTALLNLAQDKIATDIINQSGLLLHPQTRFNLDLVNFDSPELKPKLATLAKIDQIYSFGVWHHLPSSKNRLHILQILAEKLPKDGLLVISLWQFMNDPKLAARILPTESPLWTDHPILKKIKPSQLEQGDYILDWRVESQGENQVDQTNPPLRYCHSFSDDEIDQLILTARQQFNLKLLDHYQADGKSSVLNTYLIWQKMI